MNIRALRTEDLDDLLRLYRQLHPDDAPLPRRGVVEATWRRLLAGPEHRCFGGFLEGRLIASCVLSVIPNLTRGCKPYGLIENVITDQACRNRGYGKAMLAHALADAWSCGCYKVMLMTGRKDEATLRFYESAGFDPDDKRAFVVKLAT